MVNSSKRFGRAIDYIATNDPLQIRIVLCHIDRRAVSCDKST